MTKQELVDLIENDDKLLEYIDQEVIDLKSQEASNINNSGVEEQVDYLLSSGFTIDKIKNMLQSFKDWLKE